MPKTQLVPPDTQFLAECGHHFLIFSPTRINRFSIAIATVWLIINNTDSSGRMPSRNTINKKKKINRSWTGYFDVIFVSLKMNDYPGPSQILLLLYDNPIFMCFRKWCCFYGNYDYCYLIQVLKCPCHFRSMTPFSELRNMLHFFVRLQSKNNFWNTFLWWPRINTYCFNGQNKNNTKLKHLNKNESQKTRTQNNNNKILWIGIHGCSIVYCISKNT